LVSRIWAFRKYRINVSRWDKFVLPVKFKELVDELDFKSYDKDIEKPEKSESYSVEEFLKTNLMGKIEFNFEDLEELSVKEILYFISVSKIKSVDNEKGKLMKNKLINLIKDQLDIEEFSKKFFNFKKNSRISEAKKIPVDIINVDWGPPLNCYARLRTKNQEKEENFDIIIENNQIKHDNCHWVYHRFNFCSHLIAVFSKLSNKNLPKTYEFLKL